jgi:proline dehydrogenase
MISKYIIANNIKNLKTNLGKIKYSPIIDYLGEFGYYFNENKKCLQTFKNKKIALKLTSLGLPNEQLTYDNLKTLGNIAIQNNHTLLLDAENYDNKNKIDTITETIVKEFNTENNIIFYKTQQMYYKNSFQELKTYCQNNPYSGIKLVRGAYYKEDYKTNTLNNYIEETHYQYNKGIELLNDYSPKNTIIASHNNYSCYLASQLSKEFEFAQLLGMNDKLSNKLLQEGLAVYKYTPYGPYTIAIPYLIRRLYENLDTIKYL